MKLSPAVFVMTWLEAVPVAMDVTMVERGMVITGICRCANGASKVG